MAVADAINFFFCLVETGNFQLQVCPQNVEFTVRRRDICATVSLSTACICVSHDDLWVYLPRLVIYLFADLFFRLWSEDVTSLELWLANWAILFWHLCISVPIGPFFSEETTHWARSSGELGWCRIYFYVPWSPFKGAKFCVNQGLVHPLVFPNWIFKVSYLISAFGFV